MQINLSTESLASVGSEALQLMTNNGVESVSSNLSPLQKAYREFFYKKLEEHGFSKSPFEGTQEQLADFFKNLSKEWAEQKQKLLDSGEITA